MFKKGLIAAASVLAAVVLLAGPSVTRAAAAPLDFEPIIFNSDIYNCIDDPSNSSTSGTGMQIWNECDPGLTGEQWAGVPNANLGGFSLVLENGMCLDNRGSVTNGTQYVIKACNASAAQDFIINCDTSGYSQIAQSNGDVVWLQGNNRSNGTRIVVYNAFAGNANGRLEAWWQILSNGATASQNC